jgi:hypothetical protein
MNTSKIEFRSHRSHNDHCDITVYQLDKDTNITYGIYVKSTIHWKGPVGLPIQPGTEFMEIYVGENYNVDSKKRSNSRHYYADAIPKKYNELWQSLKEYYETEICDNDTTEEIKHWHK